MLQAVINRSQGRIAAARTVSFGQGPIAPTALAPHRTCALHSSSHVQRGRVAVRAAQDADDFDALLIKVAEKWEKADNKPIIVAYAAGAVFALFTAEWLMHLPGLNVLLGFPVQLLGLCVAPYLGIRWFIDGVKPGDDVDAYTSKIVEKLPGLTKKE